ncbi:hypothetical protein LCY76_23120 [Fictibacillus sp. KIGAM418]|uniref:Uncharacterized protein n=1 Tax=Fictibacillus marinisediminis TaxID=2878389 RepID=A0A9X2BHN6_9BACL|nr:hypothetical protein [Fictibacillus marinisediminis]MCK6259467.1 hypothetical protein [Fictibacillus marinisediminis]
MIEYFKFKDGIRIVTKIEHDSTVRLKARQERLEKQGITDDSAVITQSLIEWESAVNVQK